MLVGGRMPYKRRVEYLQTSNAVSTVLRSGPYIDTGVSLSTGLAVDMVCALGRTQPIWTWELLMGGTNGANASGRLWIISSNNGKFGLKYGNTDRQATLPWIVKYTKFRYEAEFLANVGRIKVDGTQVLSYSGTYNVDTGLTVCFGRAYIDTKGGWAYSCVERNYGMKLYRNDVLVRDFIPVLDLNDEPCMYDRVTGRCFYNQGTGAFLYGPDI
jgi:hypothetical protein